ncbi:MAG: methylmalonyl Co-A mutase-associated GTPase MeaB [Bacteroidales bacterium OttesenSCG-928-I14]|jgi:LAO/AO transport system kinase|nr:methylmalonyl Co-A mutase-associated GTPase MeaB [Bacteroidales bacterium OttesenSCG-928-I14]
MYTHSVVNPYYKKTNRIHSKYTSSEYVEQILKGNITILSKAISLVESKKNEHQKIAQEIIEKCLPYAGNSIRIGITGVPGAGKSTSINALGMDLVHKKNKKLAVLAVDPSSDRSKGSILGDKIRMEEISRETNVFIRPSSSSGSLGGIANKTREEIILCEASGFDTILIETVGVGQSEIAVHSMVDFFLLIQIAGAGDELQGIKRGIMEMADSIVINKADGDNIEKANLAAVQYKNAISLFPASPSKWIPQVMTYSGHYKIGITEIWNTIYKYIDFTKTNGYFDHKRKTQDKYWMYENINEQLKNHFYQSDFIKKELAIKEKQVLDSKISPSKASKQILDLFFRKTPIK